MTAVPRAIRESHGLFTEWGRDGRRAGLAASSRRVGQAALEDDLGRVSAETSQRMACDAATVVIRHAEDGAVLDVGRKIRTIPPAIRRALQARDRRCRFPGCTARRCDAHHVKHWADGGSTKLDNLVLLCRRHHRSVHEEGFALALRPNRDVRVTRPDGRWLEDAPAPPAWTGLPLATIDARLEVEGTAFNPGGLSTWQGERFDLDFALDVLRDPPAPVVRADVPAGTSITSH